MDHNEIDVALSCQIEGCPGSCTYMPDPDARVFLEPVLQKPHDARINRTNVQAQRIEFGVSARSARGKRSPIPKKNDQINPLTSFFQRLLS